MTGKHTIYCSKVLFLMRHEFTTPFIRGRCPFDNVLNKNQPAFDRTKSTRLKKLSRAYSGAQQQLVLCGCDLKPASRHPFFSKTNFASLHERAYSFPPLRSSFVVFTPPTSSNFRRQNQAKRGLLLSLNIDLHPTIYWWDWDSIVQMRLTWFLAVSRAKTSDRDLSRWNIFHHL